MTVTLLKSRALNGLQAPSVTVEVHLAFGLPGFVIVGLPETEVRESKDRVRAAIQNSGFEFPVNHLTVNLAPADLPKDSSRFDLPIALGILAASGQISSEALGNYEFIGELSLSGQLRALNGVLPIALTLKNDTQVGLILPSDNAAEAALVEDLAIYPADTLLNVATCFLKNNPQALSPYHRKSDVLTVASVYPDWQDVRGQTQAKRALEIAACGGHSILMSGPPGSGKSMLAQRFPGLLPPMTDIEAIESASVRSLNGSFKTELWRQPPFRSPHHTASAVALVGGGSNPRPGEISLAHCGVLFLDELPEFERRVLEVLREPLESGVIMISRAARQAEFPARFQLIAAMNPCPCGYLGHKSGKCRCSPDQVARYQGRISGPLIDRIDMQIEVPALPADDLGRHAQGQSSAQIQRKVSAARARQIRRQGKPNHLLSVKDIDQFCALDAATMTFIHNVMTRLNWSARAYHRVLRLARSIADYDAADDMGQDMTKESINPVITMAHLGEAVQYRRVFAK